MRPHEICDNLALQCEAAGYQLLPVPAAGRNYFTEKGALLSAVILVDTSQTSVENFLRERSRLVSFFAEKVPEARHVVITGILVSGGSEGDYAMLSQIYQSSPENPLFMLWHVDTAGNIKAPVMPYKNNGAVRRFYDPLGLAPLVTASLTPAAGPARAGDARRIVPWGTYGLLAANALVLLMYYVFGGDNAANPIIRWGVIIPDRVQRGEIYRLVTALFIHFGLLHFLYNSLALFVFGTRLEERLTTVRYLSIYLLSGFIASAASLVFTRAVAAGASGAIFGVMGCCYAYTKVTKRRLQGLNDYILLIFVIVGVMMGFLQKNVDNAAHIAGLIAGIGLGFWVSWPEKRGKK